MNLAIITLLMKQFSHIFSRAMKNLSYENKNKTHREKKPFISNQNKNETVFCALNNIKQKPKKNIN